MSQSHEPLRIFHANFSLEHLHKYKGKSNVHKNIYPIHPSRPHPLSVEKKTAQ